LLALGVGLCLFAEIELLPASADAAGDAAAVAVGYTLWPRQANAKHIANSCRAPPNPKPTTHSQV